MTYPLSENETYRYQCRMIDNGKVIKVGTGFSKDAMEAFRETHQDIDPFSGVWVEVVGEEVR